MRYGLYLPIFDELADPAVVAALAAEAEAAGWDGVFTWDHIAWNHRLEGSPSAAVADPWVTLAAVACATERIRIGALVTPLPRRRPVKVAREVASLDVLSKGRLVFGAGIGSDASGELPATGEQVDPRVRAAMLDEALEVLAAAWSGAPVRHHGPHYTVDGLTLRPTPVQRPGPPVWIAVRGENRAPLRRAARHDGVFPVHVASPDQFAEIVERVRELRAEGPAPPDGPPPDGPARFDVAIGGPPGTDPSPYRKAGATWWLVSFLSHDNGVDRVRGVIRDGPR